MRKTIRLLSLATGVLLMNVSCEKLIPPSEFNPEQNFSEVTFVRNSCDVNMIYCNLDSSKVYDSEKFINPIKYNTSWWKFTPYQVVVKDGDVLAPKLDFYESKKFKIRFRFEETKVYVEKQDPIYFYCFHPAPKMSVISILEIQNK